MDPEVGGAPDQSGPTEPSRLNDALSDLSERQALQDERTAARRYDFGLSPPAPSTELSRVLDRCRSSANRRRLTRVMAQMAGLMCLTLVKLDDRHAFRNWARTARVAAQEAGDPVTHSWVRAQEAYGHYYAGDLR